MARPEFTKNYDQFYPVETFKKIGFHRAQCPKCENFYWRKSEKQDICGDAACTETYTFIGKGTGIGRKGVKMSYSDAWKSYEKAFNTARIPCTTIDRYPVVARWRADVDFCAAGIYCFQPYCMTGELDPPANPLIAPQFCLRFNDLDNIGLTGRHYSGFIMLGLQVFNKKNNFIFFKEEVVEFNYRWLTEFLEIDPEEITFREDVWCGGGNLGPCIEYFVGGLELGNMVFIEYKTFHDGSREKLEVQVVDVGIGLERVAWLINGSETSYIETFSSALEYLESKVKVERNSEIWKKFGPYSCMLDIDECVDIVKTWEKIADITGQNVETIKKSISEVKDMYVVLDHTRSLFLAIYDGALPSNVGGGGNIRNLLRRVIAIMHRNNWWNLLGLEGIMDIMNHHKKDLERIYGNGHFKDNESIKNVFALEIEKYEKTDKAQLEKLKKHLEKKKTMTTEDWILAIQSWGIPAEKISETTKFPIPDDLYIKIAEECERTVVPLEINLYDTNHLPATDLLFYKNQDIDKFTCKIIDVFVNMGKEENGKLNIVLTDCSAFYPTSGGQQHDTGIMVIDNITYKVVNVEKVGACNLHYLDKELHLGKDKLIGLSIKGEIDMERRKQLMAHHTGTHIVFAACKRILGPHVWQNGAKKTIEKAHLDITHFKSLSTEDEMLIEKEANRIVLSATNINKFYLNKKEAEVEYGFTLYQGGVIPGNTLRIVNIENTDVEACCGTHLDNTMEVGYIKILRSNKISDGVVRLEYVAYQRAVEELIYETSIINDLKDNWDIEKSLIVKTGKRFFHDFKMFENKSKKLELNVFNLQMKLINSGKNTLYFNQTEHDNPTFFFSNLNENTGLPLKLNHNGILYFNKGFIYGFIGAPNLISSDKLSALITDCHNPSQEAKEKNKVPKVLIKTSVGNKKNLVENVILISFNGDLNLNKLIPILKSLNFQEI